MEKMQVRNRKTARQLVIKENAEIEFIRNPNTGTLFFVCGSKQGYVSPAVKAKLKSITIEELQYAECAKPGTNDWVPCLMVVGNSKQNVQKTLGTDLLHD